MQIYREGMEKHLSCKWKLKESQGSNNYIRQNTLHYYFLMFIYFERERQSLSRGGAERETHTHRFEAGSRLWAVSTVPNAGLEFMNGETMTWAEVGCLTDWATQVPQDKIHFKTKTVIRHKEGHYIIMKGTNKTE